MQTCKVSQEFVEMTELTPCRCARDAEVFDESGECRVVAHSVEEPVEGEGQRDLDLATKVLADEGFKGAAKRIDKDVEIEVAYVVEDQGEKLGR